jgi:hypothetical protein
MASSAPRKWWVLVYRVPSEPASKRVAIWRDLKRMGALYLQQCVCILPQLEHVGAELERLQAKIAAMEGDAMRLEVPVLAPADEARIVGNFRTERSNEYAEIVEECQTKFVKEIEFERFRENYTFEEAEEIAQDLEKIRRWFDRVRERDWFAADRRGEVDAWLERCQELLSAFEEDVYQRQGSGEPTPDVKLPGTSPITPTPITPLPLGNRKRARSRLSRGRG